VHQRAGHLLLVPDADDGLQHRAHQGVVVGDELCELLVLLHGQDGDGLEAGLDADRGPAPLGLAGGGRADRVPLLHELAARDAGHRDVDQAHVAVLVLLVLAGWVPVQVHGEVARGRQAAEVKVLAPEQPVLPRLAAGAGVQHVVQAQLTEVLLLGRQVFGLDDPQAQQVLRPPAVVLETPTTPLICVMILRLTYLCLIGCKLFDEESITSLTFNI